MKNDSYLADPDKRSLIILQVESFWEEIRPKINEIINQINQKLVDVDAQYLLNLSFDVLSSIIGVFKEPEYIEADDEHTHFNIVSTLLKVFGYLIDGFILENKIRTNEDKPDKLVSYFFKYINYLNYQKIKPGAITIPNVPNSFFQRMSDENFKKIQQIEGELQRSKQDVPCPYSEILFLLHFLNNFERHKPLRLRSGDWITGKKSYGNLHSLTGIFVLSTYAYLEILKAWLDSHS